MPQAGQIIPNYLQPHVMTVINDNTEFKEVTAPVDEGTRSIFVFTSPKGRDNTVLEIKSVSQLLEEYGRPVFKMHGQPIYNAYAFLSSGSAKAWCMRVMPSDATYSNVVIVAKVKPDKTAGKLKIRLEAMKMEGLTDKEDVESMVSLLTKTDPDVNGYKTYPLMAFYSQGRGVYGDSFRVRISQSIQSDRENGFKNYRVEVLELENTLNRKELFVGTLYPDAVVGLTSLFIEDKINDKVGGSQKINIYVAQENLQAIFDLYKTIKPNTTLTEETIDFIFGKAADGTVVDGLVIESDNKTIALDAPEGVPFSAGGDGAFTYNPATLGDRETAIDKAYKAAFRGDLDSAILSKRRTPAEVILDAGYSEEVKRELIALINKRYDAYGYIDAGIINTLTDAITWGESMLGLGDRIFSKEFQHFKIRDPFSGKNIPVTITFFYARMLPNHLKTYGPHVPFVGETYATLTGAINGSLKPVVDADDLDTKEKLYNLRLNYFQSLSENTFVRGTQTTSQNKWSDLSEEHNMRVLLEMKRKLEDMCASLIYNFAEAEDRKRFTEDANRLFANGYVGIKVRSAEVKFEMSPFEEERSILHCYLAVVFRTIAKRVIVEIDINKRV